MTKSLVLIRGVATTVKRTLSDHLVGIFNPKPDLVRAIHFGLHQERAGSEEIAAYERTIKNRMKRVMFEQEQYIVIENELLRPQQWGSYIDIVKNSAQLGSVIGVNVQPDENILNSEEQERSNLQARYLNAFKSTCTKYFEFGADDGGDVVERIGREILDAGIG